MFKEIGSSFWLNPDGLDGMMPGNLEYCYIKKGERAFYTSSGRGAISLLLGQIKPIRRVALLPLYTCESVLMPFMKQGYEIQFYDQKIDLSNEEQILFDAIDKNKPGIVFLHGYFGFDTVHSVRSLYSALRKQGIMVIEDITHSLFSSFPKVGADYYLASLRKWFALPDGGVAISPEGKLRKKKLASQNELVELTLKALRMKDEYTRSMAGPLKFEYRKMFYAAEDILNSDCQPYAMSHPAEAILGGMDFPQLAAARRVNFNYLLEHLSRERSISPVFRNLPDDVVPLYFPVYVNGNRTKLRAFLAEDEIYAPIHWDLPSACAPRLTEATQYIFDHILSIPVDQRYTHKDMERVLNRLAEYHS